MGYHEPSAAPKTGIRLKQNYQCSLNSLPLAVALALAAALAVVALVAVVSRDGNPTPSTPAQLTSKSDAATTSLFGAAKMSPSTTSLDASPPPPTPPPPLIAPQPPLASPGNAAASRVRSKLFCCARSGAHGVCEDGSCAALLLLLLLPHAEGRAAAVLAASRADGDGGSRKWKAGSPLSSKPAGCQ